MPASLAESVNASRRVGYTPAWTSSRQCKMAKADSTHTRRITHFSWHWAVFFVLATLTLSIYVQVAGFEFVNYDDNLYVTDNDHVKSGLTFEGIQWAFTTGHASNWHPLTWISHMTDVSIFAENPSGHHVVNVLFHLANACLLFVLLRRTSGEMWPSAFVAVLFAVHPLHVESVAWIAERKDVLSTFFWIATMLFYSEYARRGALSHYFAALLFFAFGLMSKPMLVTLPAVLLLTDFWPLKRIDPERSFLSQSARLVLEKAPFILLAAASCVITFVMQRSGHSIAAVDVLPIGLRFENAIVSYAKYVMMTIWPSHLAVFYPHPGPSLPTWHVILASIFLVACSLLVVAMRKTRPYLIVGWLWFLGTLVPVIGFVQVGAQALADRYTYVSMIGLLIMAAWTGRDIGRLGSNVSPQETSGSRRFYLAIPAAAIILCMSIVAAVQVSHWRSSITLFEHALRVTSRNYLAHKNLGVAFAKQKKHDKAAAEYLNGIKAKANDPDLYYNLGNALDEMGRRDEAVIAYRKALQVDPEHAESHYNLANVLARQQKFDEALAEYGRLLSIDPAHLGGLVNLGNTLAMLRRPAEAMPRYQEALRLDPKNEEALTNLGNTLAEQNKFQEAIEYYKRSVSVNPKNADAYGNMGYSLLKLGRIDDAEQAFSQVLRLEPSNERANQSMKAIQSARKNKPVTPAK